MENEEKQNREVNPQAVTDLFFAIKSKIEETNAMNLEVISALSSLLILTCMNVGIAKSTMLANLSNNWELNDPENDHPLKSVAHKIEIQ
jgi:hypothetical protein